MNWLRGVMCWLMAGRVGSAVLVVLVVLVLLAPPVVVLAVAFVVLFALLLLPSPLPPLIPILIAKSLGKKAVFFFLTPLTASVIDSVMIFCVSKLRLFLRRLVVEVVFEVVLLDRTPSSTPLCEMLCVI